MKNGGNVSAIINRVGQVVSASKSIGLDIDDDEVGTTMFSGIPGNSTT